MDLKSRGPVRKERRITEYFHLSRQMDDDAITGSGENWRKGDIKCSALDVSYFICLLEFLVRMKSQQVDTSLWSSGESQRVNIQKPQIGMKVMRQDETIRAMCENRQES